MHRKDYETVAAAVVAGLDRVDQERFRDGALPGLDYDTARRVAAVTASLSRSTQHEQEGRAGIPCSASAAQRPDRRSAWVNRGLNTRWATPWCR